MKNRDNEVKDIDEVIQYEQIYHNTDEIYVSKEEIYKDEERLVYSSDMSDEAIYSPIKRNGKVKALVIATGTLAIILAFFVIAMKRFNQNIIIHEVSIEKNTNSIDVSFTFSNDYGIECYYGLINSNKEIIVKDYLSDDGKINKTYSDLISGSYKFIVYEDFYGYNLNYYESDLIIIE